MKLSSSIRNSARDRKIAVTRCIFRPCSSIAIRSAPCRSEVPLILLGAEHPPRFRRYVTATDALIRKRRPIKIDVAAAHDRGREFFSLPVDKSIQAKPRRTNVTDDVVNLPVRGNRLGFTGLFGEPRGDRRHLGTDFGAQTPGVAGDDIVAATPGKLVYQGPAGKYGNIAVVERDNGDGTHSYFLDAHLAEPDPSRVPSVGQDVQAGQTVGLMSNTGASAK